MRKTSKEYERKIKTLKRKELQKDLSLMKIEKAKLYDICKKWWRGEEITLRDKEEFYHRRLFVKTLEAKRVEYLRDNSSGEYVDWYSKAHSAGNKAWREAREAKEKRR